MTIKQREEIVNNLPIKYVDDSKLLKNIYFYKPIKLIQTYRCRFFKYYLTRDKDIYYINEVQYCWNEDFTKWIIINQLPYAIWYKGEIFKSAYYVMNCGHRAKKQTHFNKVKKSDYVSMHSNFDFAVDVNKGFITHSTCSNLETILKNPIYETSYKEGWNQFVNPYNIKSNKPHVALGFADLGLNKDFTKQFLKCHKTLKIKDLSTYRDYLVMARRRNHDLFDTNWLELHDRWIVKGDYKKVKNGMKAVEQFLENNANTKETKLYKIQNLKELKELGKEEHHCVGVVYKDWENFWVASIDKVNITIRYDEEDEDWEMHGYHNAKVPERLENTIKKQILKEIKNEKNRIQNA